MLNFCRKNGLNRFCSRLFSKFALNAMFRPARFTCLRMKLIFTPFFPCLRQFLRLKRFFLKVVTPVNGPLLWWITCCVKRVSPLYSVTNLALYFFSLLLNNFVQHGMTIEYINLIISIQAEIYIFYICFIFKYQNF